MPELDLMSKCREGDIWTYQSAMTNPNRIMHIIIIGTTKGSYSFAILGTKFEHLFRHITLVRKTDQSKTWNVKPAIYTDTNFENLLDFCGQIEKPVFDLIKSELSLSLINLYKKTVEIPYNINFIPTGRVFCDKETDTRYIILNRAGEMISVCPLEKDEDGEPSDVDLYLREGTQKFKIVPSGFRRMVFNRTDNKFVGYVTEGIVGFIQWKIQDCLIGYMNYMKVKEKENKERIHFLEFENAELKKSIESKEEKDDFAFVLSKFGIDPNVINKFESSKIPVIDNIQVPPSPIPKQEKKEPEPTVEPVQTETGGMMTTTIIDQLKNKGVPIVVKENKERLTGRYKQYNFREYFVPKKDSKFYEDFYNESQILELLTSPKNEYMEKHDIKYTRYNYLKQLIFDAVNWDKCPTSIYTAYHGSDNREKTF